MQWNLEVGRGGRSGTNGTMYFVSVIRKFVRKCKGEDKLDRLINKFSKKFLDFFEGRIIVDVFSSTDESFLIELGLGIIVIIPTKIW